MGDYVGCGGNGDFVGDTPDQYNARTGCPSFPQTSCSSNDMFMNYMDYTNDGCMNIFTLGQRHRMRALFALGGVRRSFVENVMRMSITGPSVLCEPDTYTLTNVPAGATVTWTAPSGFTPSSGTGTTATFSFLNLTPRDAVITFTVTTDCGSFDVTKQVRVGGYPPTIYDVPSTVCAGGTYYAYASYSSDGYYHWDVPGGTILWGQGTATIQFSVDNLTWPNTSSTVGVTVVVHGECGNPLTQGISVPVVDCGPGAGSWLVYPNPADESLTVSMGDETERSSVSDRSALPVFKAVLYDGTGRQLRQGESKDGKVEFDTRGLANGTYFLHIHLPTGGQVEKRQVVIRH